jgi:hypothetical protein
MAVLWTIQAKRHLRQALAEALCRESEAAGGAAGNGRWNGVAGPTVDRLNDILEGVFPGLSVVVKDQVLGYRRKKDLFVLLVEAFDADDDSERGGPFVVKIGPEEKLRREIRGWESCRPPGLKHDLVLLTLTPGEPWKQDGASWMSLVYGDAQQFLGVTATVTFEAAALECVRSGFPRLASVAVVLNELYERVGHLLYSQAFVDDPARPGYALVVPRLDEALGRWEAEPSCQAARRDVNTLAARGVGQFLDPVDYLRYVQSFVPWKAGDGSVKGPTAGPDTPAMLGPPRPEITDLVPRMLRGCAHGDLHGRNILVGIVRDQAMWPTAFDYEDMGTGNLVGWDFVKLETELKVRAYLDVFGGGTPASFVRDVQAFEVDLGQRTEHCHRDRHWPEAGAPETRAERLAAILLTVRRLASQHLGVNHGRPNAWLEEYYFLLACYGASTSRFENLQPRERVGALVSAGAAAARLSWPRLVL